MIEGDEQLLMAYLDGTLSHEEKVVVEARLSAEQELKEALELERDTRRAIELQYKSQTFAKVKEIYQSVYEEEKPRIWNVYTYSIAAVVLMLIFFTWLVVDLTPKYSNEGLLESYAATTVIPDSHNLMGENQRSLFQEGLDAVKRKNWEKAINTFNQIVDTSELYMDAQFYIGWSYFHQDQYQNALAYFLSTKKSHQDLKEQSRWMLALSYLGLSEIEAAEKELIELVEDENQYFMRESAQQLLEDLHHPIRQLPGGE